MRAHRRRVSEAGSSQDSRKRIPIIHPLMNFAPQSEPPYFQRPVIVVTQKQPEQSRPNKPSRELQIIHAAPSPTVASPGGLPQRLYNAPRFNSPAVIHKRLIRNRILL
jgi:hypothetical protein